MPEVERKMMTEQRPGEHMAAEIAQQPEVLAGLVARQAEIAEVAERSHSTLRASRCSPRVDRATTQRCTRST
jgi:hypothetical protein